MCARLRLFSTSLPTFARICLISSLQIIDQLLPSSTNRRIFGQSNLKRNNSFVKMKFSFLWSCWNRINFLVLTYLSLGGVHKLCLQDLAFLDHLPPSVYIFYGIKVYKKSIFLTTYPPPLVNVVCERPLVVKQISFVHILGELKMP